MASRINFPATAFLLLLAIAGKTSATTYVVGGSSGWTVPSGGAATYAAFSSRNTFQVGDHLVFNFPTGVHDLAIVSKQNYDSCGSNNPISLVTTGPATVNLTSIGEAYFICTFNGHCSLGQKLAVNVSAASSASPVPAASPPPMPPTPAPKPSPVAPAPPTMAPKPSPVAPAPPTMAPKPSPAAPAPSMSPSMPAPAMSPPSMAPAPGPGGAAPMPSPAMAPSPGGAGGGSLAPAPAPGSPGGVGGPGGSPGGVGGPGGSPGDVPPSAAPATPTATAALVFIASVAIANFF